MLLYTDTKGFNEAKLIKQVSHTWLSLSLTGLLKFDSSFDSLSLFLFDLFLLFVSLPFLPLSLRFEVFVLFMHCFDL